MKEMQDTRCQIQDARYQMEWIGLMYENEQSNKQNKLGGGFKILPLLCIRSKHQKTKVIPNLNWS
jgi:hypothetical protein